ncbi:glycoside hydrolase family 38 C-terminal domain-containing protein [Streptomyces bungoensis]|uniref:glycoside hydrolase family 38 C-terminal domain-containing protein n=1 Tax=Streptomyces bungoensis TaxID=285568 RepID=UPI003F4D5381
MHDDRDLVEARLRRVLDERIRPAVYPESVPLRVAVWHAPGEPVPVAQGLAAEPAPIEVGARWGAPWGTSWFRVTGTVPERWAGRTVEALLDLGFDENLPGFQCEGLVYRPDGTLLVKGLHPLHQWVRVGAPVQGGEEVRLHVEAASNPVVLEHHPFRFRPTPLGDKDTAGSEPQYTLTRMDLAVFDETVWQLVLDLVVLGELMAELPVDSARRWEILRAVERALDAVDLQDVNWTAARARDRLTGVLAAPAVPSAHRISAVAHAHIDSAWLWPLRETVRKVARTAAGMTALIEDEPDFVFAMSQAQQWAWGKEHRPEVWARVRKAVAEGRFVPTGGMWVESDTTMPGSEAMARQFVHGKRFFLDDGVLRVEIDSRGLVVSAYDVGADRETIAPGGAANLLQLHPDLPNRWDAWDVDRFYRNTVTDLTDADAVTPGEDGASVRIVRSFGASRVTQVLSLPPGERRLVIDTEVDWHETEKFLKLAFPLDLHAERYASETQFGHVFRPTHTNTSWEAARFEACNHRFVHLEEPGWGVAVVNDSTYGHDVTRTVRTRGTTTTVRVSLLRAPASPTSRPTRASTASGTP